MESAVVAASVGTGSNVGAGKLGAYLQNTDVSIYRRSLLWTQDPRVGAGTGLIVAGLAVGTCEESKRWRRRTQSEVFSRGVCR